jgi:hypothetical protein
METEEPRDWRELVAGRLLPGAGREGASPPRRGEPAGGRAMNSEEGVGEAEPGGARGEVAAGEAAEAPGRRPGRMAEPERPPGGPAGELEGMLGGGPEGKSEGEELPEDIEGPPAGREGA